MAERGSRLDELQGQSENLSQNARGFNRRANQLRKDMWWKDMKMRICIIVGIVVLLIVIIAPSGESLECRVRAIADTNSLLRHEEQGLVEEQHQTGSWAPEAWRTFDIEERV